jgi:hypothetical protein
MSRLTRWVPVLISGVAVLASTTARADTPGCSAAGPLPAALPSRLLFGWGASSYSDTWAAQSGTKWDVEWTYLSGQAGDNWYNTWGYGAADGSFADTLFSTFGGSGFIPGIHLYNMGYGHDTGDIGLLTEIQNPSWTTEYFTEFKVLMQKAKAYGQPVVVVLEGDSFGMVEMLVNNDPTTAAAVASTGLPELANLPNTVAGFGLAFLAMRQSVGATNVVMGPDTPYYASGADIMNFSPSDTAPLQSYVDYQWSFFGALGVGPNATGDRFDFSASCPRSTDQGYYTDGRDLWDPSDGASVDTPSMNRYIEWLSLYNQASGVRWMLHQVPIGNSQHLNIPYSVTTPRSGYKDIFAEYLFQVESPASTAIRDQHLANFANAGVLGLLFGFSEDGELPTNDLWLDNKPFLNTHVPLVANAGGFAISNACGGSGSSSGGATGSSSSSGISSGSSGTGTTSSGSSGTGTTSSGSSGTGTTSSSSSGTRTAGSSSSGTGTTGSSSSGTGTTSSGSGHAPSGSSSSSSGATGRTDAGSDAGATGSGSSGGCALATQATTRSRATVPWLLIGLFALRRRSRSWRTGVGDPSLRVR